MTDFSKSTIGVTGAAGHLGRAVISYLQQRGATDIVAITRDPAKLPDLKGVTVRRGDFDDPASLATAFTGIDRLLIISTDQLGEAGARIRQHTAAVDAAGKAGVSHIVYTSITNPYPDAKAGVANDHFWTEQSVFRSIADWTILRNNIYADMLLHDAPRAIASGQLIHAAGTGRRAYVTRDDVAATAAGVLLTATGKTVLDVSGPEAPTLAEVASAIANASGKPIEPIAITREALVAGMVGHGLPEHLADTYAAFDTDTARGVFGITSDAVQQFAGRAPTRLADFLAGKTLAAAA